MFDRFLEEEGRGFRRFKRRLLRRGRRRLEETATLVHVSVLLFVPLLIGLLTYLSTRWEHLSFFLFPPLAAGTYALFAHPESKRSSPIRFVTGLTAGAVCAWVAVGVAVWIVYPDLPPTSIEVDAPGAAFAIFLTGVVTWAFDIEEAAAFSTALLGLLVDPTRQFSFVVSVFLGSSLVAVAFTVWRNLFYERRAQYLYESTEGDDHVLVPVRDERESAEATAILGGRLAAAHEAGKVVLLDVVEEDRTANAKRALRRAKADRLDPDSASGIEPDLGIEGASGASVAGAGSGGGGGRGGGREGETKTETETETKSERNEEEKSAIVATVTELERLATRIESELEVPCQVIVATSGSSPAETVRQTATEANCDLIAVPYEAENGDLTPFVTRLLRSNVDVLVHRSHAGRTDWRRIVVPVRRAGDTAHNMIDFGLRLAGSTGRVSVAHCADSERRRRVADTMLANLVETFDGTLETRVANSSIERFLRRVAPANDLLIVGASRDRSAASRLVSPPTFERTDELDADVAIVDRR
ncbi:HPP family protein [Halomontanus rarus]|uniref:HPP family protein n=1 Tax=Halomontanus rarus TaxID=3034020 RepID=UPI001A985B46